MRRKGLWLSLLATAVVAGSVSASTVYSGNGFDFFTYHGNVGVDAWNSSLNNINGVQLNSGVYQSVGIQGDGIVSPGAQNLQRYDFEQSFWAYDGDENGGTLHIGLVTGLFRSGGEHDGGTNGWYNAGDLFVGLGNGQPPTQYAIGLSTNESTGNALDDRKGKAWGNTGAPNWTTLAANPLAFNSPWRVDQSAGGAALLTAGNTGFSQVEWTQNVVGNRHNFVAVAITIADAQAESLVGALGGLSFHWTMECGNDVIDVAQNTPLAPLVPVPAAAPLALLGMGIVGIARRYRGAKC